MLQEEVKLKDGTAIPKIGLGTWLIPDDKVADTVRNAIKIGYRHIDTAQAYNNERGVGEGVRTSGVGRDKLFVVTKLRAEIKNKADALKAIDESLRVSGLDYFDMMLIHAPQPWTNFRQEGDWDGGNLAAWNALEDAVAAGKLRHIGVSNFERNDLENLINNSHTRPEVNQILTHITNVPRELLGFCREQNIVVEAYSPMGHGAVLCNEEIRAVANKYGVSVSQLCIRFCIELGMVALPKATGEAHLLENADVNFTIKPEDMEYLLGLETIKNYGSCAFFPVYGGHMNEECVCVPDDFVPRK